MFLVFNIIVLNVCKHHSLLFATHPRKTSTLTRGVVEFFFYSASSSLNIIIVLSALQSIRGGDTYRDVCITGWMVRANGLRRDMNRCWPS